MDYKTIEKIKRTLIDAYKYLGADEYYIKSEVYEQINNIENDLEYNKEIDGKNYFIKLLY